MLVRSAVVSVAEMSLSWPLPTAVCLLWLSGVFVQCQRYIVPEASLEFLSPRGLKISIPDIDEGVSLVAFHININEEFETLAHGHWAQDIIKKRGGRWTYTIPEFKVKQGDTIWYWVYVIVDGLGYQALDRSYKVTQANPHGTSDPDKGGGATSEKPPGPVFTPDRVECNPSQSSYNGGKTTCQGQVILEKDFSNLDGWSHDVQIGTQPDDEFTLFTKDSTVSFVKDRSLVIKPILLEEKFDSAFVSTGHLDLKDCTSNIPEQCSRTGATYLILPPVMSARLTTKNRFSFCYGTVEIKAKLPRGDWIVPELWLQPKSQVYGEQRSDHVVLALSRGNMDFDSEYGNWLLESGVLVNNSPLLVGKTDNTQWSKAYHTFKLIWAPDYMKFFVDGKEFAHLPSGNDVLDSSLNGGKLSPFDKEFYITLGLHVAGIRDFPDDMKNKTWKNSDPKRFLTFWLSKDAWHSSWDQDSALRIKSVKVTAL